VRSGTLVNALLWHCEHSLSDINGVLRPGIVHRLDRDTSGVIVAAKSNKAHLMLSKAFNQREVVKEYNTIVCGNVVNDFGRIDLPIGRDPKNRKKMAVVSQGGRQALTLFETVERFGDHTWLKIDLKTGRTHQIRVHMSYIGHPVAGDAVYGPAGQKKLWDCGQILHSTAIEFEHPVKGERMRVESPLPAYFTAALDSLRK
jgi:23S rRNA pseudouridine1911/1915/1917 synthase